MHRRLCETAAIFAVLVFGGALIDGAARAGVLDSYDGAVGGGYATVNGISQGSISTPHPNDATPNGAGGPSPNGLDVSKTFTKFEPLDMVFTVSNSGGVTSYWFDEDVTNLTGVDWKDYHFELGFGTGLNFVLGTGGLVVFDATNPAAASSFANGVQTAYTVSWNGPPGIPNGGIGAFEVQILVSDVAPPDTSYKFTLRQYPTVPEPSSVILLGAGCAVLLGCGVRRRRA